MEKLLKDGNELFLFGYLVTLKSKKVVFEDVYFVWYI